MPVGYVCNQTIPSHVVARLRLHTWFPLPILICMAYTCILVGGSLSHSEGATACGKIKKHAVSGCFKYYSTLNIFDVFQSKSGKLST